MPRLMFWTLGYSPERNLKLLETPFPDARYSVPALDVETC